jgi:hypothetical protein
MVAEIASTADVAAAAYCRKLRPSPFDYRMTRCALARIAVPIGRGNGRGRPLMWRRYLRRKSSISSVLVWAAFIPTHVTAH